jgi:hypothetical protein
MKSVRTNIEKKKKGSIVLSGASLILLIFLFISKVICESILIKTKKCDDKKIGAIFLVILTEILSLF